MPLDEVHVAEPLLDRPDPVAGLHARTVGDRRDDVPVREDTVAGVHDERQAVRLHTHLSGRDRVHRRTVRAADVDAEVERRRLGPLLARIVEEAAHGMLPVDRRQRPAVRRARTRRRRQCDRGEDDGGPRHSERWYTRKVHVANVTPTPSSACTVL